MTRRGESIPASLLAITALLSLSGCSDGGATSTTVTVGAASSLTAVFTAIEPTFARANPDIDVEFTFAGSGDLVTQITEGAPIDVFAAADLTSMDKLTDAGVNVSGYSVFATNSLVVITAPGNPAEVDELGDLTDDGLVVVIADEGVPLGRYTRTVLESAGVAVTPSSLEQSATGVVGKVVSGEADAGVVYLTDAMSAGDSVGTVTIPDTVNVVASYPIVVLPGTAHNEPAGRFVEFLRSDVGRDILESFGFGPP